jgi:hypothetical protein
LPDASSSIANLTLFQANFMWLDLIDFEWVGLDGSFETLDRMASLRALYPDANAEGVGTAVFSISRMRLSDLCHACGILTKITAGRLSGNWPFAFLSVLLKPLRQYNRTDGESTRNIFHRPVSSQHRSFRPMALNPRREAVDGCLNEKIN